MIVRIEEIAEKYGISIPDIIKLVKQHFITGIMRKNVWYIDKRSVKNYLKYKEEDRKHKKYMEELLAEKKEEMEKILANHDDFLFTLRTFDKYSPLFERIVIEMSLLIPNEDTSYIFKEISLKKHTIYELTEEKNTTYDKICHVYEKAFRLVCKKVGSIQEVRRQAAQAKAELRHLESVRDTLQKQVARLAETLKDNDIELPDLEKDLPLSAKKQLCRHIGDISFSTRVSNCLQRADVKTLADLFGIIKNVGFEGLLKLEGFGHVSLEDLKSDLMEKGLLDAKGKSSLFDYIE